MKDVRDHLNSLSQNEGLIFMINSSMLDHAKNIQASWINRDEKVVKYEDLLRCDSTDIGKSINT